MEVRDLFMINREPAADLPNGGLRYSTKEEPNVVIEGDHPIAAHPWQHSRKSAGGRVASGHLQAQVKAAYHIAVDGRHREELHA